VKCWAHNRWGKVTGSSTPEHIETPTTPAGLSGSDVATEICASYGHSCALMQTGSIKCWGRNRYLQLGVANSDPEVVDGKAASEVQGLPDPAVNPATSVSCHEEHSCAMLRDNSVWCWGRSDSSGQLGVSSLPLSGDYTSAPVQVTLPP
jgi:alpha-tubulin suppressor-like RCC1 family protein